MGRELASHEIPLLDPHPVLAGQASPHLHAEFQDLGTASLGPGQRFRIPDIEQDQRMQIAVAGVEDVRDPQSVAVGDLGHPAQRVRQAPVGITPSMQR